MIIVISLARFLGYFLRKIHQPRVIAEVIGGILLGPSAFGRIPGFTNVIFPKESIAFLKLVAELGLILFLFLVGLELDPSMLVRNAKQSAFISIAGMAIPFVLGVAVSSVLYNSLMPENTHVPFASFFLFLGIAMSITAFPVLARILTEKKLLTTLVGMTTISAAAVDDFASWCFLGLVISIINATNGINALYTFLIVVGYALILILGIRRGLLYMIRWSSSSESLSELMVFATFILVFVSSFITEVIGVHAIFGAFLVGVIIPHGDGFAMKLTEKIEDVVTIIFLPLYFASSGLKTNVSLIDNGVMAGMLFLVIFVACAGKIVGCLFASKLSGLNWRESFTVGVLMNTKGLVELIVLNLGLDAGVINDKIFVIMVLMALVTTFMTSPIVSWIYPLHLMNKERENFSSGMELSRISSAPGAINDKSPESETTIAEDLRALICLEAMDSVPTLMHLVQILQNYRRFYPNRTLKITALRLMELSERASTVMKVAESSSTLRFDPVINVFKTFCNLNTIDVNPILAMANVEDFGENIVSYAEKYNVNFILLPWLFPESMGLEQSFDLATGRKKQYRDMVSYVLNNSNVSAGVLVDHGFTASTEFTEQTYTPNAENSISSKCPTIFMPYLGGEDDREALMLLLRLAAGQFYKVVIARIRYGPVETKVSVYDASKPQAIDSLDPSPAVKVDQGSLGFLSSVRQRKKSNHSNNEATSASSKKPPALAASPQLTAAIAEEPPSLYSERSDSRAHSQSNNPDDRALLYFQEQAKRFPNFVIEEYESPDPPALAINLSLQLGKIDLVVVGKSHPIINLFNSLGTDASLGQQSSTVSRLAELQKLESSSLSVTNTAGGASTTSPHPVYDVFQNHTIGEGTSAARKLLSVLPESSTSNLKHATELKDSEDGKDDTVGLAVNDTISSISNTLQSYKDEKFVLGWLGGLMRRKKIAASLLVFGKGRGSSQRGTGGVGMSLNIDSIQTESHTS